MRLNTPADLLNAYFLMLIDLDGTPAKPSVENASEHFWQFLVARRPDIASKIEGTPADPRQNPAPFSSETLNAISTNW